MALAKSSIPVPAVDDLVFGTSAPVSTRYLVQQLRYSSAMQRRQQGALAPGRDSPPTSTGKASSYFEKYQIMASQQNPPDHFINPTNEEVEKKSSREVSMGSNILATTAPVSNTRALSCHLTGRPPIQLYLSADCTSFSPYQLFVRKNIEFFESTESDVQVKAKNRSRPILLGQVGIRCRFCNSLHACLRTPGATVYPSKKSDIYQSAQNIVNSHWTSGNCAFLPMDQRAALDQARSQRSSQRASKATWRDRATALGVYEDDHGLRFADSVNALGFPSTDLPEIVDKMFKK